MKKTLYTSSLAFLLGPAIQTPASAATAYDNCHNERGTENCNKKNCEGEITGSNSGTSNNGDSCSKDSGSTSAPGSASPPTDGGSIAHNGQLRFHNNATDYTSTGTGSSSCGSCSGAPSSFDLPTLSIQRHFVSRTSRYSPDSFGRKVILKKYTNQVLNTGSEQLLYINHEASTPQVRLVYNSARRCWIDNYKRSIYGVFLYNAAGAHITDASLRSTATKAIVVHHDGSTEHHEYYNQSRTRPTAIMDRRGNATTISYQDSVPADLTTSNALNVESSYRRISTITDAYGRQASFSYHPVISNRYHYISSIQLPNSETVSYQLGTLPGIDSNTLTKVTHPDGTESNFSSTEQPDGIVQLSIQDPTANGAYSHSKTVYISTSTGVDASGAPVASVAGMIRRLDNGLGEMSYANRAAAGGDQLLFEGGNKVSRFKYSVKGGVAKRSYLLADTTSNGDGTQTTSYPWNNAFFSFDQEVANYQLTYNRIHHGYTFQTLSRTDGQGRVSSYSRHPVSQYLTQESFNVDGTTHHYSRNQYQQPLQIIDRLGRTSNFTYDGLGNLLSSTRAVGTNDEITSTNLYNLRGQLIEARDPLYDANHPELHNTRYEYNTAGYLIKKIASADTAGGSRPETVYTYDTAGRLATSTDPLGRLTSFTYDTRSRLIKTTYNDSSYEEITYGIASNANLVTQMRDRNGIFTTSQYDNAGRRIQSQISNHQAQILSETNSTYLTGTQLKATSTHNGDTTIYSYDHYNRLIGTSIQANANTVLTTQREIDQSHRLRSSTDAYGRKTYYLYDHDDRTAKVITETVPGGLPNVPAIVPDSTLTATEHNYTLTDKNGNTLETNPNSDKRTQLVTYTDPRDLYLENLTRNLSPNAKYLITETIYDAEGQRLITTDARGNSSWTEYDALGRTTLSIQAVGTPAEIRSEQDYDDNSNVVETRSPRYFTEGPGTTANLTGVGKDSYTYNGRNMRSTHTTAVGSTEAQTQSWTYLLDGRSDEHTDFRGNIAKSLWHACCGRLQATIQRDGTSTTIHNTDYKGQATHTAVVSTNPNGNWHDPIDQDTLAETTTRFDGRGRPTHTTTWLQPLGTVDDNARLSLGDAAGIPIAGLDGIPATDGLTTTYLYDEDLTDGVGIDSTYSTQLAELTTRYGYNPFGTGANGYAVAVTNPAGETTVQVTDGAGRTILTINPEGDIATMHYDEMVAANQLQIPNLQLQIPGDLLATKSIDALDNENIQYSDAAGRTIARADAEGNFSYAAYNANGSVETSRDANGLGQTCEYDALNRPTTCADLQETAEGNTRTTTYNAASQALTSTNADGETTTNVYDVRSRLASTTDPNNIVTDYTYDANNNLITLSDGKGNLRHWFFDARNLNTTKVHQGNAADAASSSDFYTQNFDALGRVSIKVDQIGTICTMNYDLAGRMTEKQYHTGATPAQGGTITPGGTLESTDTFSYDAASRLTATTKGRHNISTEHTYAADSMPLTEKLVADGRTYESTRSYDAANRPLSHIYPNGKSTYWAYTERNLVASIHYEDKLVADQSHDAGYRLTSQNYGNGLDRTISYGRQDNLRTADSVAGKQDLQMTYSYAADKQITAETIAEDVLADTSFTASYDAGNRITNWNRAGAPVNNAQSWNYDDNGNWISTTKDGTTEARNHDNTDQLTQIAGKASTNDAKGNLTAYEQNGKEYEIDYDLDNRIIKVDIDNNDVEYRYDALGRRVIRQEGTTKTALIWWGNSECAEHKHQAGQTVIQNDIMAHPSRLNSVIARAVDGSKFKLEWYHKNYLDHVYAVSDDSGDILEHYRYTAFGEVQIYNANGTQVATTQIDNHILWNTRRRDEVTGYYMYKFRHYSAELGRWLARDPIEEWGGYNLYEFVNSQPTWYWDYLGLHHRVPAAVKKILKDAKNTRQGRGRHPSGLKGATPNNLGVGTRLWTKGPYKSFAKNMKAHWKKHRGEFPEYNNLGDYVRGAHRELHTLGNLSKVRVAKNGDVGVYNPQNNSLTICNNKGVPKTHYKPDPKHPNYEPFEKKFPLEWDGKWVQ